MSGSRIRWVLLLALLLLVPLGLYQLLDRSTQVEQGGELDELVPLSLALIVLTVGLVGVLIRNLVVLIVERKRGILGSNLRMKLVFFYLALVLLPAIVLFSGSAQVIKQTVEAILRTPLDNLSSSEEVVASWTRYFEQSVERRARELADEVRERGWLYAKPAAPVAARLERVLALEGLALVQVLRAGEPPVTVADSAISTAERSGVLDRADGLAADVRSTGQAAAGMVRLSPGLVVVAAAPTDPAGAVVVVALEVPLPIAADVQQIHLGAQAYEQARLKRRELVRFYVTLIGLVFIATLFVATWIGLYVARRITEPIREVAAATREISAGNLDVRVRASVGDEMGLLVDAFNEMAAELEENREVITRSTADLRSSNKALDERRRYIETLVANLSTAVISLDPTGRVTTANPAVERILGVAMQVGDDARVLFARHGFDALNELLAQLAPDHRRSVRRDLDLGDSAPTSNVSVQLSPLRGRTGEDLGTLLMVEDLTDVLRAQKVLAWQEVAQRIAHEIKNPLTPIQLAAQRLRKKFTSGADDLGEVLIESTDSIEHEVAGLKQLVDEFSRFARMPQVAPRPVDLRKVIDSVLSLYRGLGEIEWVVELDPRIGVVRVDPQQLRRALINLVDNATTAVNGRGKITLAARVVGSGNTLRIEVADSGPGIPTGDRDKMFIPYFSTKHKGTGLGLAIVHKVVTDHRGTIRVEDNEPQGARFVIEIPA